MLTAEVDVQRGTDRRRTPRQALITATATVDRPTRNGD